MARILVNMPSQHGGRTSGVARVAFALLERLLAIGGHDYALRSSWSRDQLPVPLRDPRLTLIETPRPRVMIADVIRQRWAMPGICRRHGIDLVWNVDPFGAGRGAVARVTTVHDLYFDTIPDLVGRRAALTMAACTRMVLVGSDRIVAISGQTRADLARLYPRHAARTRVIANDSMLEGGDGPHPRAIAEPYVLLVGNGTPNKNFAVAVQALATLPNAPALVHVGRDEAGTIDAAMAILPQPPRLIRPADIDDHRLAGLYAHALCLIAPSVSEGFCLPILEAQSLGCPVIASQASVMPEVAGDGALFFDPHDSGALAARLTEMIEIPGLREALIARGTVNRRRYSWDRSAAAYAALFDELTAARA